MTLIYSAEITEIVTGEERKATLLDAFSNSEIKEQIIRFIEKTTRDACNIADIHITKAQLFPDEKGDI